jgi:hypothetical protein
MRGVAQNAVNLVTIFEHVLRLLPLMIVAVMHALAVEGLDITFELAPNPRSSLLSLLPEAQILLLYKSQASMIC